MLGSYSVVVKKSYTIILVIALKLSTAIEIPLSIGFDWILGRWVSSKQENHHEEKISFNLSLSESCLHSNVVSSIPFSWTSRQRYRWFFRSLSSISMSIRSKFLPICFWNLCHDSIAIDRYFKVLFRISGSVEGQRIDKLTVTLRSWWAMRGKISRWTMDDHQAIPTRPIFSLHRLTRKFQRGLNSCCVHRAIPNVNSVEIWKRDLDPRGSWCFDPKSANLFSRNLGREVRKL